MTLRLVLATHNAGKVAELRRILAGLDVVLQDAGGARLPDVEETGDTFIANALLKARAGVRFAGVPCIADDSGLVVDALGGEPGVRSARYGGEPLNDQRNLAVVLERMRSIDDRSARFVCVAALATPDGREWTTQGVVEGTLTRHPRGSGGFGYDPIFVPDGHTRTTAEMSPEQKDALSHRGEAFRAIRPAIAKLGAEEDGSFRGCG